MVNFFERITTNLTQPIEHSHEQNIYGMQSGYSILDCFATFAT